MQVKLGKRRGRHRMLDQSTGEPAIGEDGQPIDGGGRKGKFAPGALKSRAIEINEADANG